MTKKEMDKAMGEEFNKELQEEANRALEIVLSGISMNIGGAYAVSAVVNKFVEVVNSGADNKLQKELEEMFQEIKDEFAAHNIEIEYKINCCPHKENKE